MRRKEKRWRREEKGDNVKHWLEEGSVGQESLLLDVEPQLYLIDQVLCKKVTQLAYQFKETPLGIIIPPAESVSWQICFLSKLYDLLVWGDDGDELLLEAAKTFDVEIFSGDIPEDILAVQLFLYLDWGWQSVNDFLIELREVSRYVAEDGEILFVLQTSGHQDTLEVHWQDGSSTVLSEIIERGAYKKNTEAITFSFSQLAVEREERLNIFLKRHREFFGKNIRELFLRRITESEFQSGFDSVSLLSIKGSL